MAGDSLMHDCAVAGAAALLDVVAPALHSDERREFFHEAYRICMATLNAYSQQMRWEAARLYKPSCN